MLLPGSASRPPFVHIPVLAVGPGSSATCTGGQRKPAEERRSREGECDEKEHSMERERQRHESNSRVIKFQDRARERARLKMGIQASFFLPVMMPAEMLLLLLQPHYQSSFPSHYLFSSDPVGPDPQRVVAVVSSVAGEQHSRAGDGRPFFI